MADFLRQFIAHNRMLEGGFVIEDRLVTLADIECPILSVVGTVDEIAPAPGVRAIRQAAPRAEVYELALKAGHFGLVVGSTSNAITWPTVAGWVGWRSGEGELPGEVTEIPDESVLERAPEVRNRVGYGLELAGGVGAGMARSAVRTARGTLRGVRELSREAAGQLPRLARLEQIQPTTRISLGLLVAERRRHNPEDIFFLFEDRAYNALQINERIDNVVRGLISIGVRRGEHVGVLMGTRPSALALAVALSRLGAVAVMLRPDGDVRREAELGQVVRIIADPERAGLAAGLGELHTFVLGGGGAPRDLDAPATDMEQIDPEAVELPKWYRPNPGRASDMAFILFTGQGEFTRMSRITNQRLGAVRIRNRIVGGALGLRHRVQRHAAVSPVRPVDEHRRGGRGRRPARDGLALRPLDLLGRGAALRRDRRLLHVDAPARSGRGAAEPGERHHPVRLFIGSGMPRGLWRRVQVRFTPARVLEFYASTEAGAILVNLSGSKEGCMGRPLPGSAPVRIASYDLEHQGLVLRKDGFAQECAVDEVGMLLAKVRPSEPTSSIPMRGVFSPDDAWLADRRPVPPRRRRRLLAGGRPRRRHLDRRGARVHDPDPRRAGLDPRHRPRGRLRGPGSRLRARARRRRRHAAPGGRARGSGGRQRPAQARRRPAPVDRPGRRPDSGHHVVQTAHAGPARGRRAGRRRGSPGLVPGRERRRLPAAHRRRAPAAGQRLSARSARSQVR